jgi:hypothetical protein
MPFPCKFSYRKNLWTKIRCLTWQIGQIHFYQLLKIEHTAYSSQKTKQNWKPQYTNYPKKTTQSPTILNTLNPIFDRYKLPNSSRCRIIKKHHFVRVFQANTQIPDISPRYNFRITTTSQCYNSKFNTRWLEATYFRAKNSENYSPRGQISVFVHFFQHATILSLNLSLYNFVV